MGRAGTGEFGRKEENRHGRKTWEEKKGGECNLNFGVGYFPFALPYGRNARRAAIINH